MENLAEHYERLLGLDGDWQVLDVELVLEEQRVAIRLESVKKVARMLKRHLGSDTELVSASYKQRHGRGI